MGRYFYPTATDALSAKKMFLREYGYRIGHCFQNTWGTGYVLFDSKSDVNAWYKEHTGRYFYTDEYEPGTIFTREDAYNEIEQTYGREIDAALSGRDKSLPILALGLPSAFGNNIIIKFAKSSEEQDIEWRFYVHYDARTMDVNSDVTNTQLRKMIVNTIYHAFYESRFKKRIEGSKAECERRAAEKRKKEEEIRKREALRLREEQQRNENEQRERSYYIAYQKYLLELNAYENEMKYYNEAMSLKKRFSYGGQFPNGAWLICFLLFLGVIFLSFFLSGLEKIVPYGIIVVLDIVILLGGYRLIFKKLKLYLEEENFDNPRFEQWVSSNPKSPLIRYIRNNWPPSKPIPPIK